MTTTITNSPLEVHPKHLLGGVRSRDAVDGRHFVLGGALGSALELRAPRLGGPPAVALQTRSPILLGFRQRAVLAQRHGGLSRIAEAR